MNSIEINQSVSKCEIPRPGDIYVRNEDDVVFMFVSKCTNTIYTRDVDELKDFLKNPNDEKFLRGGGCEEEDTWDEDEDTWDEDEEGCEREDVWYYLVSLCDGSAPFEYGSLISVYKRLMDFTKITRPITITPGQDTWDH